MSDHRTLGHDGIPRQEQPLAYPLDRRDRFVTPDGVELAGWWRRAVAYLIDGLAIGIGASVITVPIQLANPGAWVRAAEARVAIGSWTSLDWMVLAGGLWTAAAMLLVGAAYSILMHSRLGWTLGKRALGIRVRHRDRERLPTVGEAAARWAVQLAPAAVGQLPGVASLTNLWTLVDGLWPLWDHRRQAIHDKVARTSVVRA